MFLTREKAETIGLQALAFIAGHEDLLPIFMGATGASEEDLKIRAQEPEFLAAVLDFLMMDDAWVIMACDHIELPYEQLMHARQSLPGGAQVEWT